MELTSTIQGMSLVLRKDPRGRRRAKGYDRAAPLSPLDRARHRQIMDEGKIISGRFGGYVYAWRKGKVQPRRYVIPRDPHTPAQLRSRAAFRKASKAWSESQSLTEELRSKWYAAAAKVQCRPRLTPPGRRTAQQHFVGTNSLKERWGLPLLLQPPEQEEKHAERRKQNTEAAPQVPQPQKPKPASSDPRRTCTGPSPDPHRAAKGRAGRPSALRVPIQVAHSTALTRPASDRPHTPSIPLPVRCRCQARYPARARSTGSLRSSSTFSRTPRTAHLRELWRGG